MGANLSLEEASLARKKRTQPRRPMVALLPYYSTYRLQPPPFKYIPVLGRQDNPIPASIFNFILNTCPLPRDTFRPFPSIDQAAGRVVKSFHCRPPGDCYARRMHKIDAERVFYRIHCAFPPNDESSLFVSAGTYAHRPGQSLQRVNYLFDGLLIKWTMGTNTDLCQVVKGSRSPDCHGFSMSADGRLLTWPTLNGFSMFDRHSAATCGWSKTMGNCVKAIALSPSGNHIVTVSGFHRQFFLCFHANVRANVPFGMTHKINLTSIDPSFAISNSYREHVAVRWSSDETRVGVSSSEGHFFLISRQRGGPAPILMAPTYNAPGWHETRLSSVRAFDFSPWCNSDGQQRVAFATNHGRVFLFDIDRETTATTYQIFPPAVDLTEQVRCMQYSNTGLSIAIGLSFAHVILIDAKTLVPMFDLKLKPMHQAPATAGPFFGVSCLAFSCTDRYLAVGTSDGIIHIWCLDKRVERLAELTKRVIRSRCPPTDLCRLPVPSPLCDYLKEEIKPIVLQ